MGISGWEQINMEITPDEWGREPMCFVLLSGVTLFTIMYPPCMAKGFPGVLPSTPWQSHVSWQPSFQAVLSYYNTLLSTRQSKCRVPRCHLCPFQWWDGILSLRSARHHHYSPNGNTWLIWLQPNLTGHTHCGPVAGGKGHWRLSSWRRAESQCKRSGTWHAYPARTVRLHVETYQKVIIINQWRIHFNSLLHQPAVSIHYNAAECLAQFSVQSILSTYQCSS